MAIDNDSKLIGKIISPINQQQSGNYKTNYFEMEIETGSTESKPNIIFIKLSDKMLERFKWNVGDDYSGSKVACVGTIVGSIYNGKNYINFQTSDLQVFYLKNNNKNYTQYTPENNYNLPPKEEDEFNISDDDLPW